MMLAADIPPTQPAAITICREHKPASAREYWSWREIEGRRCYYAGRPGKPKSELRWRVDVVSRPAKGEVEPAEGPPQVPPGGLPSVQIISVVPAGAEGSFVDRWLPVLGCGYHINGTWDCRRKVQP